MLDLAFVRENLDAVRDALATRGFPPDLLDRFAEIDRERRAVIGEADTVNQQRNAASKEIGALMQSGRRDEA
jgi:seryl-tRNA synthetase